MQKVIFIIVAIFSLSSVISAQVADTTIVTTSTQITKQDTLIVSNPNTVIIYQGAKVPVVYAQPNTQQLIPANAIATNQSNNRGGKVVLSALVGGFAGLLIGGSVASNNVEPTFGGFVTSPFTIMAGALTGGLIGTGAGIGFGFALSSK